MLAFIRGVLLLLGESVSVVSASDVSRNEIYAGGVQPTSSKSALAAEATCRYFWTKKR